MQSIQIGETYTLTKPTFLYKGILILKNSQVEIQKISEDKQFVSILYIDKEQNPHTIDNIEAKYIE